MNRRKIKREIRKTLREILRTGYFVNCNYHPIKLTEYGFSHHDVFGTEVAGIGLTINKSISRCSVWYCNPEPISEEKALEMVETWKQGGDRALAITYGGYTEEQYTQFEKEWR